MVVGAEKRVRGEHGDSEPLVDDGMMIEVSVCRSSVRFSHHVEALMSRSRKLVGQSLTDHRVIAVILEHVNRVVGVRRWLSRVRQWFVAVVLAGS